MPDSHAPTVSQDRLDDLRRRLDCFEWPNRPAGGARPGFDIEGLRPVVDHWRTGFDWRVFEARLDGLGQAVTATADRRRLWAIHAPGGERTPILLVHGWPDSPLRFIDLVPLLTAAGHDVVAPAIPGFGFSDEPDDEMSIELVADDFHNLMTELGYDRYAVHGGDFGSAIATAMAVAHPDAVAALHLTDAPFDLAFTVDREAPTIDEIAYLDRVDVWATSQLYLTANMQQPDVVALALADSPIGLLAWLAQLYDQWTPREIAVEHLLANATLLWTTGSVRSSMRLYSEPAGGWDDTAWDDAGPDTDNPSDWAPATVAAPTAFALCPHDIAVPPREYVERHFRIERFTTMTAGGHFAALEQPEVLAADIVAFLDVDLADAN